MPFSLVFPGNRIHHSCFVLCDLGVGRQTEKGGVPEWWCILLFPCNDKQGRCIPAMTNRGGASRTVRRDCPIPPSFPTIRRFFRGRGDPTVPQGHKDRVTALAKSRGPPQTLAEPRTGPQRPRRTLEETPAEAPESETL